LVFRRVLFLLGAALLVSTLLPQTAQAEQVTEAEARQVAENWLKEVVSERGSWGDSDRAELQAVEPLQKDGRLLAYIFPVDPIGCIAVSPLRELAPIRAYSVTSGLDPQKNPGGVAMFSVWQEVVQKAIEAQLGRAIDPADDLRSLIPVRFDDSWAPLLDPTFHPMPREDKSGSRSAGIDYQEGESLLEQISWSQEPPYNDQCPGDVCEWPGYGYYNDNYYVGCVATAGAMISRYWNWPLTGTGSGYDMGYDWRNMAEQYDCDGSGNAYARWNGNWYYATQEEVDAVALISHKMGTAVSMDYGCDGSSAFTIDLADEMPSHFRYHSLATHADREDYAYMEWISLLMGEFNNNRPVAYKIPGHAIVLDGWDEDLGTYYLHIVYGWNGSWDGWFTLGEIHEGGSANEQTVVYKLLPESCIGLPQAYYELPAYPYRYLERDLSTPDTEFAAGHNFQVRKPGFLATGATGPNYSLRFNGAPGLETVFYLQGDPEHKTRIRIKDGAMEFKLGGQMAIY